MPISSLEKMLTPLLAKKPVKPFVALSSEPSQVTRVCEATNFSSIPYSDSLLTEDDDKIDLAKMTHNTTCNLNELRI